MGFMDELKRLAHPYEDEDEDDFEEFEPAPRLAALDAAGSLHDDVIAGTDIRIGRVKIIAFAVFFETDRNDFFHSSPRLLVRSIGKKAAKGPVAPF